MRVQYVITFLILFFIPWMDKKAKLLFLKNETFPTYSILTHHQSKFQFEFIKQRREPKTHIFMLGTPVQKQNFISKRFGNFTSDKTQKHL